MATTEGDITLTAANIAAEKDVTIRAAGNLTVQSGQDTVSNANTADSKAIGTVQISDTEKFAGWHRQQHEDDSGMVSQVASTIGSLGGNVNLGAGGKYTQIASNVVAAQDVNITAAEIELLTANESGHNSQSDKDLKIGVFARIKSPFIDLINNVDAARQSDGRLAAMQGMAAGANAYQAGSAIVSATKGAGSGSLFSAEAGIGFKSSSSSAEGSSTVSRGSTIQGGGNVNLTSTSGDIHVVQGNLSAGKTLALDSAGDILLEAGKAHLQDKSRSNNAGAEVGVGVSVGAQTGVYVYAEASVGSSKSNADSSTWQNTTLTGQNISLKAEGDTTLRGATATADRIDVKTGGTLTIESLQDVAESMSKDSQVGGRVQVSVGTAWDASGYASAGKANGSYKGVGQQSGLFAGDGGYHVDAGHVNLVGGAIASTNAANSELTAQSLTFTDLKNEMDYRASSASISGGFGNKGTGEGADKNAAGQLKDIGTNVAGGKFGNADGTNFSGGVPMTSSGSDSSTTYATLTEGNITIGGKKVTAAELGVNTDASKAHEAINALPDLKKLMQEQQAMSSAAGTVVATSKQVAGDVFAYKSEQAKQAFEKDLKGNPEAWNDYVKLDSSGKAAYLKEASPAYRDALKWGTGGEYSRALDAVTTAIVGSVAGQGGGQVAANALAPYAAEFIGSHFDPNHGKDPNATLQLISHALLGALLAEANGGSAGNGAAAAAGGELAAKFITDYLYGGQLSKLDDKEKQNILALSQAVGAIAGSLAGEGLSGAALGANLSKNSVENNWLSKPEIALMEHERAACDGKGGDAQACKDAVTRAYDELNAERDRELFAYAKEVELSMRQYPAVSEQDYKDEWSARMDLYWQQYPGIPVDDRVAGRTPGADFAYGLRQLKNDLLVSGALNVSGILGKGLDGWLMDKTARDAESMRAGLIAQWNLISGVFTSPYPAVEIQGAFDQASVMTATEESLAYLALLRRVADKGIGAAGSTWGIKGGRGKHNPDSGDVPVPRSHVGPVYATNKEATQAAKALGYQRVNETVHNGQLVFRSGSLYITRDLDGHNGGAWKVASSVKGLESKSTRIGTFDANMNKIGD